MKKFKEWDKKKKIICLVVVLLIVIVAGLVAYKALHPAKDVTNTTEVTHVKTRKTKKCPIDFQAYWDVNPEVVAYVEVPDTDVSYPILRRADDAAEPAGQLYKAQQSVCRSDRVAVRVDMTDDHYSLLRDHVDRFSKC